MMPSWIKRAIREPDPFRTTIHEQEANEEPCCGYCGEPVEDEDETCGRCLAIQSEKSAEEM